MAAYDRDEVLARTDLRELATELCGDSRGLAAGAKWRCPNPDHPDEHPSMSVYDGSRSQRWRCHACGDGGTAIDLVMTVNPCGVREAIEALAERAHLLPNDGRWPSEGRGADGPRRAGPGGRRAKPLPRRVHKPPVLAASADPCVEAFVATAAEILWTPAGETARAKLRERGFSEEVLRANRVGFDPGPRTFSRPQGLPGGNPRDKAKEGERWGPGLVYPALGPDGAAVYFQIRYLEPLPTKRDKYDNPSRSRAPNPYVAVLRVPDPDPALAGVVVVAEGMPDGYVSAQAGATTAAVIGANNYGPEVVRRIHEAFPVGTFLVPYDRDRGGRRGGCVLSVGLGALGRDVLLSAPAEPHNDLNDWWKADPAGLRPAVIAAARPSLYALEAGALTVDLARTAVGADAWARRGDWASADVGVAGI